MEPLVAHLLLVEQTLQVVVLEQEVPKTIPHLEALVALVAVAVQVDVVSTTLVKYLVLLEVETVVLLVILEELQYEPLEIIKSLVVAVEVETLPPLLVVLEQV
jgi:hypothetical protein